MIVKNEEDCIARCLNSVKDVVDEIMIVDTGSTDNTINICQSFEAKIERFEWNGSFADARNYGIQKATGEWIIWLDADEELDEKNKYKLHEGNHFNDYDVIGYS
jgi:glycosyltransferase involved in cell wall biosynthesis